MKNILKNKRGITLIALVITIVVLVILAGVIITLSIENEGLINKTKIATEDTKKQTATDIMNLKITNIQISSYTEYKQLPDLQYVSDKLCDDNDVEYVVLKDKEQASLQKITVGTADSILTKLKEYPYVFEINNQLQLASIDGIKVATVPTNDEDSIVSMTKAELKDLINTQVEDILGKKNYDETISNMGTASIIDSKSVPSTAANYTGGQTTDIYTYTAKENGVLICSLTVHSLSETSCSIIESKIIKNNAVYGWNSCKDYNANQTYRMSSASSVINVSKGDVIKFQTYIGTTGKYYYSYGYTLIK